MSFLIPAAIGIISGIISNNSAKAQQASAQQGASDLATQTFNQQTAYISAQEQAQRDAIAKIAAQGNPYMQAQGFLRPPNPNQYGTPPASGQVYRGGSGTPAMQAPQLAPTPAPAAPGPTAGGQDQAWNTLQKGVGALAGTGPLTPTQTQVADMTQAMADTPGASPTIPGNGYVPPEGTPSWMDTPGLSYQDVFNRNGNPTYANMEWKAYQAYQAPHAAGPSPAPMAAPAPGMLRPPPRFNPLAQHGGGRGVTQPRFLQ